MVLVFYPIDSNVDRVEYDSVLRWLDIECMEDSEKALRSIVERVDNTATRLYIFDMSVPFTTACGIGGYNDMVEMYNDEDLDNGYWSIPLNLTQETIVEILYPNSEEDEEED